MKKLVAFMFVGMMAAAVSGCHSKNDKTTPGSTMGDAGAAPTQPPPPPAS